MSLQFIVTQIFMKCFLDDSFITQVVYVIMGRIWLIVSPVYFPRWKMISELFHGSAQEYLGSPNESKVYNAQVKKPMTLFQKKSHRSLLCSYSFYSFSSFFYHKVKDFVCPEVHFYIRPWIRSKILLEEFIQLR